MLKDMTDSRRIDEHVQAQKSVRFGFLCFSMIELFGAAQSILHPTIISQHFWPSLESSDMAMPERFQESVSFYTSRFATKMPGFSGCRMNMQKNFPVSNRTRNFAGYLILEP
jgi:anaphase-promoting complex subunit 2